MALKNMEELRRMRGNSANMMMQLEQERFKRQQYNDLIARQQQADAMAMQKQKGQEFLGTVIPDLISQNQGNPQQFMADLATVAQSSPVPLQYNDLIQGVNAYKGMQPPAAKFGYKHRSRPVEGGTQFETSNDSGMTWTPEGPVKAPTASSGGGKAVDAKDKAFAKTYISWVAEGGSADSQRQIAQVDEVLTALESGKELTGPITGTVGNIPLIGQTMQSVINPEAINVKEKLEEVVQRNLRVVLGAQFTEKEGERLISRAYNPKLDEATNAMRVRKLLLQMQKAASMKDDASKYFEANNTLDGWQGQMPTMSDFMNIDFDEQGPGRGGGGIKVLSITSGN